MPQFQVRTVTCPSCDNINPYGVTVCMKCGAPLVAALPAPVSDEPPAPTLPNPLPSPMPAVTRPMTNAAPTLNTMPPTAQPVTSNAPSYLTPLTSPQVLYGYPVKSRGSALILEILPWFAGFLGIGWLYAGNATAGVLWLVGFLMWNVIAIILDLVSFGFFACLHVPANIAMIVISAVALNNYTRQHPELFGA